MPRRKATNPDGTPKITGDYKLSDQAIEQRRANARKNSGVGMGRRGLPERNEIEGGGGAGPDRASGNRGRS
jgi:hypothetical protein